MTVRVSGCSTRSTAYALCLHSLHGHDHFSATSLVLSVLFQDAEYAAAQQAPPPPPGAAAAAAAAAPPPVGGQTSHPYAAAPPVHPAINGSSTSNRLADSLRVTGAGAMQRLSSGSQQLWQGVRRMVDPQAPLQLQPYPPPTVHPYPAQHSMPPPPPQQPYPPTYTQPPAQAQQAQPPSQQQQQRQHSQLSEDEALALALQRQFDLEEQQLNQQQQQQQAQQPRIQPQAQAAPARPAAPAGPLGANLPPVAAAAAGWQPGVPAMAPPPHAARPTAAPAVPPPGGWPPAAAVPADRSRCSGCGGSLVSLFTRQPYITALGRSWHPQCLLCAACGRPIAQQGGVRFMERGGQLFHAECHKQRFHPRCDVCAGFVPEEVRRAEHSLAHCLESQVRVAACCGLCSVRSVPRWQPPLNSNPSASRPPTPLLGCCSLACCRPTAALCGASSRFGSSATARPTRRMARPAALAATACSPEGRSGGSFRTAASCAWRA